MCTPVDDLTQLALVFGYPDNSRFMVVVDRVCGVLVTDEHVRTWAEGGWFDPDEIPKLFADAATAG
ncbi:hypothetical protein [Dactylosporangium sp. NPDC049140]|uniref:hypothetical protein n=1 Tax=Dactylosporangium sp. NPDC049140 TaxID=3155647 RepID=UPI0033D30024